MLEQVDVDELAHSALLPSVRGGLLERAGRHDEAVEAFTEAVSRSRNDTESAVLRRRAEANRALASRPR